MKGKMNEIWNTLYNEALKVLKPRKISKRVKASGVVAASFCSTFASRSLISDSVIYSSLLFCNLKVNYKPYLLMRVSENIVL